VLVPMYRAAGVPIRDAAAAEVCRRMAIDLIGRVPTPVELEACTAQAPGAMADTFMAMPEYAAAQARWWAEAYGFDVGFKSWYGDNYDLDALTRMLFAQQPIAYADYVARAAVHPAFYAVHQGDDWAAFLFSIFLGRSARPDEIAGFRPLLGLWVSRSFCDGRLWFEALQGGGLPAATEFCKGGGFPTTEWAADFCTCAPGVASALGCRTTVLGRAVDFGAEGCPNNADPGAEINFVRLGDSLSPGMHDATCADGSARPECRDRALAFDVSSQDFVPAGPLTLLAAATAAQ